MRCLFFFFLVALGCKVLKCFIVKIRRCKRASHLRSCFRLIVRSAVTRRWHADCTHKTLSHDWGLILLYFKTFQNHTHLQDSAKSENKLQKTFTALHFHQSIIQKYYVYLLGQNLWNGMKLLFTVKLSKVRAYTLIHKTSSKSLREIKLQTLFCYKSGFHKELRPVLSRVRTSYSS